MKTKYTEEYVVQECSKYKSQKEIREHNRGLLGALDRHPEWKERALAHMERPGRTYWTYSRIKPFADKCSYLEEMAKKYNKAYQAMCRNGWQYDFFPNTKRNVTYDKTDCINAAKQCESEDEFKSRFLSLHDKCKKNGWYEEVIEYIPKETRDNHYKGSRWREATVENEAKKYETRTEFRIGSCGAVMYADAHPGMMDRICAHMKIQDNLMKRCIYAAEFPDNHAYIGLTWNIKKRWHDHVSEEDSAVYEYIIKTGQDPTFKIVHDFVDAAEAKLLEGEYEEKYKNNGWIILNKVKTGSLGTGQRIYNHKAVIRIAQTCSDYTEFQKKHRNAYKAACAYGWTDEIKGFLDVNFRLWTKEELTEKALLCKTHMEFYRTYPGGADAARRMRIYDKITAHMPPMRRKWTEEEIRKEVDNFEWFEDFQKTYPSATNAAKRLGIYKEVFGKLKKKLTNYTAEYIEEEIKKYKTLHELIIGNPNLYKHLQTKRVLDTYYPNEAYRKKPKKETPYIYKKKKRKK